MPFNTSTFSIIGINLLYNAILALPVLLIALPIHECAHGFVAYLLGDNTAKSMHRLTLNPFKHLDLIGSLGILLLGFGWAKPVPVNPYNFKHRKADMAVTALAGPLSNLIMAFLSVALLIPYMAITGGISSKDLFVIFILQFASINIGLCLFNLIPIPPLDGSRILAVLLPENALAGIERMGILPVIIIMFAFSKWISAPISNMTYTILNSFINFLL